jgi:hypothetical protein
MYRMQRADEDAMTRCGKLNVIGRQRLAFKLMDSALGKKIVLKFVFIFIHKLAHNSIVV